MWAVFFVCNLYGAVVAVLNQRVCTMSKDAVVFHQDEKKKEKSKGIAGLLHLG